VRYKTRDFEPQVVRELAMPIPEVGRDYPLSQILPHMGDSYLNGTMYKHWANTMTTIVVYTLSCPFFCTNGSEIAVQEPPTFKE